MRQDWLKAEPAHQATPDLRGWGALSAFGGQA